MSSRTIPIAVLIALASAATRAADCQRVKLTPAPATPEEIFGHTVAIDGDVALVNSSSDELGENAGAVFLVERRAGIWGPMRRFVHPEQGPFLVFGSGISVLDDCLAIGIAGLFRVDIWERDAAQEWVITESMSPADMETGNLFAATVGMSRNVLAVGAPYDSSGFFEGGSVYIYERDPNGNWSQSAEVWPDDVFRADRFGLSLAVDRRRIVAGAPEDDDLGFASGSAYVFEEDPNAGWVQTAKLLPSDGGSMDVFGAAVAIQDGTILVGAQNDNAPATSSGSVYVFEEVAPTLWWQRQKLTASDGHAGQDFGVSVALDGDVAVIGAYQDIEAASQAGAAYVFVRQPNGQWVETAKLTADDAQPFDKFGNAVAVSGTTAIIGAWLDDEAAVDSGSAYIFRVGPDADGDGVMDACECPGDLDGDFLVSLSDLAIQLANFGMAENALPEDGDLDADGDVDLADLSQLLSLFGTGCQ